jgi:5-methylthioadenosine/S-adenosylhomocysteine deaminase
LEGAVTSVRKTLIVNALLVRSSGKVYRWARGDLLIDGDRIAAIEAPGAIPSDRADAVVDGARLLVMPGLINGHMHSWDHYLKGCLENLTTEVAMSLIRPRKAVALTPRQMYLRTVVGALESLRTGATTIVDDLSLGQLFSREHIDAAFQAYEDTGTRAFVGFSMIDRAVVDSYPFGEAEFPPALLGELRGLKRPTGDQLLGLVRDLAAKGKHPKSARVATLVSPSAPHRCTDGFLVASRKLADELDLPVMTHCQETRMQLITAEEFYGRSLVAHLDHLGFLKENTSLIHATWLSKRDIEIIARSGASVQYNPWSNAIMGSGVAPLRALLDAGINVSMGSDGCGLLYGVNMLNTLGTGAVLPKIASPDSDSWPTAEDIFRAGCEGGAKAFGLGDRLGKIEPGFKADLVCYDLDATTLTPLNHPVRQVVYGERGAAIREVFVDGRHVVRDGRNALVDETALLREMQAAHADLGDTLVSSQADAAPFHDALMRVYLRALSCPIAGDHYAALMTGNNIAGQTPNA